MENTSWGRHVKLGGVALGYVFCACFLRLNVTASAPYGFYLALPVPAKIARGMLVTTPVPPSLRFLQTIPLLKPVAGIVGDSVCVEGERLSVAGVDYGPVYHGARGQRLEPLSGCLVVGEGDVFLASHAPHSLDGRYFGMTAARNVTAHAVPLLTWR